eukprot:TRINITY_DN6871_c1_g1_i1.p2 TRINITY_DN6871_c1_g1~~TRINITY_DN6871_c1_g1_i1.p2  ORF type:complete len:144 (+),score=9.95 TRINITY_DN6871_c1_g1_i1:250-681(+)
MPLDTDVEFTCSSVVFDVIKIRKVIKAKPVPVKVEFGLDFNRITRERAFFLDVRDSIFDGSLSMETHNVYGPMVTYRKGIVAPQIGRVNVKAGFSVRGLQGESWSPFFGITLDGGGGNTVLTRTGLDIQQRVPLTKRFKLEAF